MKDLIERLEKATGPDRAIDAAIHLDLNPSLREGWRSPNGNSPDAYYARMSPAYTASIDSALTLVPEMHEGVMDISNPIIGRGCAQLWGISTSRTDTEYVGRGISHAIALCIAALKARAAQTAP